eukprot:767835-Hanusia_phi.AAC.6
MSRRQATLVPITISVTQYGPGRPAARHGLRQPGPARGPIGSSDRAAGHGCAVPRAPSLRPILLKCSATVSTRRLLGRTEFSSEAPGCRCASAAPRQPRRCQGAPRPGPPGAASLSLGLPIGGREEKLPGTPSAAPGGPDSGPSDPPYGDPAARSGPARPPALLSLVLSYVMGAADSGHTGTRPVRDRVVTLQG